METRISAPAELALAQISSAPSLTPIQNTMRILEENPLQVTNAIGAELSRILSACESFATHSIRATDPNLTEMQLSTWKKRESEWKKLKVKPVDLQSYELLKGFIQARNSYQHGMGKLTKMQEALPGIHEELKSAKIERIGDRIVLEADDITRLKEIARNFTLELDRKLLGARLLP